MLDVVAQICQALTLKTFRTTNMRRIIPHVKKDCQFNVTRNNAQCKPMLMYTRIRSYSFACWIRSHMAVAGLPNVPAPQWDVPSASIMGLPALYEIEL